MLWECSSSWTNTESLAICWLYVSFVDFLDDFNVSVTIKMILSRYKQPQHLFTKEELIAKIQWAKTHCTDCWQKPIPFRKGIGFLLYIGNFRNEIVFFCIFWRIYRRFRWFSSIFSSPKEHFLQIMARKNQPSILLVFLQAF